MKWIFMIEDISKAIVYQKAWVLFLWIRTSCC